MYAAVTRISWISSVVWLAFRQARLGVVMKNHERSAETISDALLKLEAWLTRELRKS